MELTLRRLHKRSQFTLGTLSIAGEPFCQTLEPTWRDIAPGGKGRKVPGFAGIRIHAGNTVDDTAGCILVGTTRPLHPGRLYDSRLWLHRLMRRLAERPLGEGVWITIINGGTGGCP